MFKASKYTAGPFRIIETRGKILTIDEHGLPQTISIDRVTHEPETTSSRYQHSTEDHTDLSQNNEKLRKEIPLKQESSQKDNPHEYEFVFDKAVCHIVTGPQTKYGVR